MTWYPERPAIFEDVEIVARKSHVCCECHRKIDKGERYHFAKGLWDGHWSQFRTCLPCSDLRNTLRDDNDPDGVIWYFGTLRETAHDVGVPFPPPSKGE